MERKMGDVSSAIKLISHPAEMIKYASKDFLALKISYMNDIANLCELVGADIEDVAEGIKYDRRIGDRFLDIGIISVMQKNPDSDKTGVQYRIYNIVNNHPEM